MAKLHLKVYAGDGSCLRCFGGNGREVNSLFENYDLGNHPGYISIIVTVYTKRKLLRNVRIINGKYE